MKKVFVLILMSFYLFATSGISVTLHYCGGKLSSFSFTNSDSEKCCCGKSIPMKGCCHSHTISLGSNAVHQQSLTEFPELNNKPVIQPLFGTPVAFCLFSENSYVLVPNIPPPPKEYKTRLYLEHRVFRI